MAARTSSRRTHPDLVLEDHALLFLDANGGAPLPGSLPDLDEALVVPRATIEERGEAGGAAPR